MDRPSLCHEAGVTNDVGQYVLTAANDSHQLYPNHKLKRLERVDGIRGQGQGGSVNRLLRERQADKERE